MTCGICRLSPRQKGGGIRGDLDLFFCTARPSAEHRLRAGGRLHRCDDGLAGGACGVMNVGFMDHPCMGRYCRRHNTDLGGEVALCWNRRLTQQPSAQRFIAFAQTFFRKTAAISKNRITLPIAQSAQAWALCAIDISPVMDVYGTKDWFLHERTDKTISNLVRVD